MGHGQRLCTLQASFRGRNLVRRVQLPPNPEIVGFSCQIASTSTHLLSVLTKNRRWPCARPGAVWLSPVPVPGKFQHATAPSVDCQFLNSRLTASSLSAAGLFPQKAASWSIVGSRLSGLCHHRISRYPNRFPRRLYCRFGCDTLKSAHVSILGAQLKLLNCLLVDFLAGLRCLEQGMLTAFHCQLDYSGTGVSLGDSADVECRDCTFARLVFGSFGAAAGVTQEVRSKITPNHSHPQNLQSPNPQIQLRIDG